MSETKDKSGIQVIARAAAILRALKDQPRGASLGQIAKSVDLPRSTVQRIVGALMEERLVIANPSGRGLRLGTEIRALAQSMRNDVVETCRELLEEIASDTGETADLSVMRPAGMIFLDQVPGHSHRLRTVSSVGEVFPMTTPANGKACLAMMPSDAAENRITQEWNSTGAKGEFETLMTDLKAIQDGGLAYDLGDHTAGIAAIGFAFADHSGDLYAISVPIPVTRLSEVQPKVEAALRKTARYLDDIMR